MVIRYKAVDAAEMYLRHHTTVNRFRPLRRLAFNTARPPRELILAKKPCSRFLGILFG
jgi:hypothetical protein